MTNEEAIKELKYSYNENITDNEALEMAIKALEQEPCEDAISRQAAIDALSHMCSEDEKGITVSRANVNSMLRALPSVNPQRTGHWIFDEILDKHYYCSECKSMGVDYWDFCPNCGARMIEPQESEGEE